MFGVSFKHELCEPGRNNGPWEWENLEGLGTPWRKKALREWGRQADLDDWDIWRKSQGTLYQLTKKTHGRERYLLWGTRKQIALKFLFRVGRANLRANQHVGDEAICRMCDQGAWETEQHVLISCPKYTQEREIALSELEKVWGPARLHSWKSKGDIERAAEWLTSGRAERKDERETDGV